MALALSVSDRLALRDWLPVCVRVVACEELAEVVQVNDDVTVALGDTD